MEQIVSALGMTQDGVAGLGGLVAINDPTIRIRSDGWDGKVTCELDIVARKTGATPLIFLWQEL
jgi:hypothetical protein